MTENKDNLFGSINKEFNLEVLAKLMENGKKEEAKSYVKCYFARTENKRKVIMFFPSGNLLCSNASIRNTFLKKSFKIGDFSLHDWFFEEEIMKKERIRQYKREHYLINKYFS